MSASVRACMWFANLDVITFWYFVIITKGITNHFSVFYCDDDVPHLNFTTIHKTNRQRRRWRRQQQTVCKSSNAQKVTRRPHQLVLNAWDCENMQFCANQRAFINEDQSILSHIKKTAKRSAIKTKRSISHLCVRERACLIFFFWFVRACIYFCFTLFKTWAEWCDIYFLILLS